MIRLGLADCLPAGIGDPEWITGHKSIKPNLPFMMLWASGSMHSPHHAPDSHIDKYKGKFDMGWDKAREQIIEQQIAAGVVPPDTKLTERIPEIPAWDSLPDEEKELYARQMEVFAAQLEWVDMQIGRVVKELERIGELDNTLIFVTADNGASGATHWRTKLSGESGSMSALRAAEMPPQRL